MNPRDTNVRVVIAVLNRPGTHLLIVEQSASGKWGPPKGHVERNEDRWLGACRELYEETNLDLFRINFRLISIWENVYTIRLLEDFHDLHSNTSEILSVHWTRIGELIPSVKAVPEKYNMWMKLLFLRPTGLVY